MSDNPYELWSTRKSLGVMRDTKSETVNYFRQWFPFQHRSTEEYIDFEKLPIRSKKLAPFALPLGEGGSVYDDSARAYRVKPAYVVLDDVVDPLKPLTYQPGIDQSRFDVTKLSPKQRLEMLKVQIAAAHRNAWDRRMEWLAARAIIDGQVTLSGPKYPTTLVNFQRAAGHTVTLGAGDRFGEAGVSILDFFKAQIAKMCAAEFGGMPTRITMSGTVAAIIQADEEILKHMDINTTGGRHQVERGILAADPKQPMVYRFGTLFVAGNSGVTIELWVNDETYQNDAGVQTRYLPAHEIVFTSTPDAVAGHECFGRIVDQDADYEPIPLFPKNYRTGDRVKTEHVSHTSSPLEVPINPNATLKAAVIAAA
ncbi:major capsid protein [Sphingopyxis sp. GW247-27LB]|uniref:major capsid protein n=1 Tax=Sphingopyxis sp. GW247-27LB TaxID=2012632 RepID=UPI001595CA4F|nr:major capsid protein [Sphingopyxis sp. GW247-27LB]